MQTTLRSDKIVFDNLIKAKIPFETSLEDTSLKYGELDPEFLCSFLSNGTHIHNYLSLKCTKDEVIIFLHAMGGNNKNWLQTIAELRSEINCLAIDLPFHGFTKLDPEFAISDESVVAWLAQVLKDIPFKKIHLVGHSMGARIAVLYASKHPGTIASLNLFNPAIAPSFRFATDIDIALIKMVSALNQPSASIKMMEYILSNMLIRKTHQTKLGLKYAIHEMIRDQQDSSFQGIIDAMKWMETTESNNKYDWSKLSSSIPVAIIVGEKDIYCPISNFEDELVDDITLVKIKNSGHLAPLEHASVCANTIRKSVAISRAETSVKN